MIDTVLRDAAKRTIDLLNVLAGSNLLYNIVYNQTTTADDTLYLGLGADCMIYEASTLLRQQVVFAYEHLMWFEVSRNSNIGATAKLWITIRPEELSIRRTEIEHYIRTCVDGATPDEPMSNVCPMVLRLVRKLLVEAVKTSWDIIDFDFNLNVASDAMIRADSVREAEMRFTPLIEASFRPKQHCSKCASCIATAKTECYDQSAKTLRAHRAFAYSDHQSTTTTVSRQPKACLVPLRDPTSLKNRKTRTVTVPALSSQLIDLSLEDEGFNRHIPIDLSDSAATFTFCV